MGFGGPGIYEQCCKYLSQLAVPEYAPVRTRSCGDPRVCKIKTLPSLGEGACEWVTVF